MKAVLAVAGVLSAASAVPAHADAADTAEKMAVGVINRTRRAIAIGPEAGYVAGFDTDGNGFQGVSFGLALYTFKIPTLFDLQGLIESRTKARVQEYLKDLATSGGQAPADLSELIAKIHRDVRDEIMGEEIKPRLLEKPKHKLVLEGIMVLDPGGFQVRAGYGRGLKHLSVGLGGGYQRTSGSSIWLVGSELSVHLTPIGKSWTPVVDGFLRGDIAFASGDQTVLFLLGARLTLDLL